MDNNVKFVDNAVTSTVQLTGKLFSPAQILLGTVLGGVASGVYFMAKNYEAIGDIKKRNMTYFLGLFFTIAVVIIVINFDVKLSGSAFAAGLGAGLSAYTRTFLLEHQISTLGRFFPSIENKEILNSNWHVLGAIIGGIIVGVIISLSVAFIYSALEFQIS